MEKLKNILKSDTPTASRISGQGSHFPSKDQIPTSTAATGSTLPGTEEQTRGPSDISAAPASSTAAATTSGPERGGNAHVGTVPASEAPNSSSGVINDYSVSSGDFPRTQLPAAGSGTAVVSETSTYSSSPLAQGDPTSSIVNPSSSDPLTYKKPESGSQVTGAGVSAGAATAAATLAFNSGEERKKTEMAGYENPYRTETLDPRVDGLSKASAGTAATQAPTTTSTSTAAAATGAGAGLASAGATSAFSSSTLREETAAPGTLTTTVDPANRSAEYGASTNLKGLESDRTEPSTIPVSQTEESQPGVVSKVLGAVGLGGVAGALGVGGARTVSEKDTSAVAETPEQPTTTTGISSYTAPTVQGTPTTHHRKESIPTTAYPSGTFDSPRAINQPVGGAGSPVVHGDKESHVGRDIAAGAAAGTAVGATAVGAREYEKSQTLRENVVGEPQSTAPILKEPGDTTATTGVDPARYSEAQGVRQNVMEPSQTGEASIHHATTVGDATGPSNVRTGLYESPVPIAPTTASTIAPATTTTSITEPSATTSTTIPATVPVTQKAIEEPSTASYVEKPEEKDYTARDATVGATAGTAAAGAATYGAHEYSKREAEIADTKAAKEQAAREKELAKEKAAEQKELEKQHKADEKAAAKEEKQHQKELEKQEKQHQKEVEKEEKRQQKEMEKEEKQHQKELEKHQKEVEKEEKQHQKEVEKEEKRQQKELEEEEKRRQKEFEEEEKKQPRDVEAAALAAKSEQEALHAREMEAHPAGEERDIEAEALAAKRRQEELHAREMEAHRPEAGRDVEAEALAAKREQEEKHAREEKERLAGLATAGGATGAAAGGYEQEKEVEKEKKPSLLKRNFKRRKNKDTGEDEDYSSDEEVPPSEHKGAAAAYGSAIVGGGAGVYGAEHEKKAAEAAAAPAGGPNTTYDKHVEAGVPSTAVSNQPSESITGLPYDSSKDPEAAHRLSQHTHGEGIGTFDKKDAAAATAAGTVASGAAVGIHEKEPAPATLEPRGIPTAQPTEAVTGTTAASAPREPPAAASAVESTGTHTQQPAPAVTGLPEPSSKDLAASQHVSGTVPEGDYQPNTNFTLGEIQESHGLGEKIKEVLHIGSSHKKEGE